MGNSPNAFAIWVTGLPASGKSTIVKALSGMLAARGVDVAVLESDVLRTVFTPHPRYDGEERNTFYRQLAFVGTLLTKHGVPVIFDATANLRKYRDAARQQIPQFLEIYVDCPLEVCMSRDPKGIYRAGREGAAKLVPGLQDPYEPPLNPDVLVRGDTEAPEAAARRILSKLIERGLIEL
ncbi:MAG TPA: adenylyl-sulfate kinase [Bryobacteraceae bacterium]|nr:adenylyl-sulfate kinase [Bryobacteraceae bacterium]